MTLRVQKPAGAPEVGAPVLAAASASSSPGRLGRRGPSGGLCSCKTGGLRWLVGTRLSLGQRDPWHPGRVSAGSCLKCWGPRSRHPCRNPHTHQALPGSPAQPLERAGLSVTSVSGPGQRNRTSGPRADPGASAWPWGERVHRPPLPEEAPAGRRSSGPAPPQEQRIRACEPFNVPITVPSSSG